MLFFLTLQLALYFVQATIRPHSFVLAQVKVAGNKLSLPFSLPFKPRDPSDKSNSSTFITELTTVLKRTPNALKASTMSAGSSFLQSIVMLVPIGLLLNVQVLPLGWKAWVQKGGAVGLDWSKIGAIYVGGEVLSEKLRNVSDRVNVYIGSGLSTAALRINEGPAGMLQGFVAGYAFMYVLDKFFADSPQTILSARDMSTPIKRAGVVRGSSRG
ncbi:hypothetical protein EON65_54205, partial [archaeon]